MSERELDFQTFARLLTEGRFDEIFEGRELEQFYTFLRNRTIPAGSLVVSIPLSEGGLFWVDYKIENVNKRRKNLDLKLGALRVFVPDDPSDRSIPEELQDVPVWWLEGENNA